MDIDSNSTGIPGFDRILGGGLPARGLIVLTGSPGTGKTVLASQTAFAYAARNESVIVATVTSEPHSKLLQGLEKFAFFDPARVGREVYLVSAYPYLKQGPREAREVLLASVRDRKARLLFVDGIRALRDLWNDEAALRDFYYELGVGLAAAGCTGLLTSEYPVATLADLPEGTTVDGIVSLSMPQRGVARPRKIEVVKLRGRAHLRGEHALAIDSRGVNITPRVETRVVSRELRGLGTERATFGVPGLDEQLGGGIPLGSQTLLAGSTGMGKSLLAAHFAAKTPVDEHALYVTFQEPTVSLIERARGVGLDLAPLVQSGRLQIEYRPPVELDPDEVVAGILARVESGRVSRLVVDSVGDLERAVASEQRLHHFLAAFSHQLRSLGTTALFTKEVPKLVGPELDFSGNPLAVISQNLIYLRALEHQGEMCRGIATLKMAASQHESRLRAYDISSTGFHVRNELPASESGSRRGRSHGGAESSP